MSSKEILPDALIFSSNSSADTVNLSLGSDDRTLRLSVEDNGVGFQVEEALAKRESYGLAGMRERVALLGGQFDVRSRPAVSKRTGKRTAALAKPGTQIVIQLPIPQEGIW